MKAKIATIIGARPQFIKASQISKRLQTSSYIDEVIIHTGQHYDKNMSDIFFKELGIKNPNYTLKTHASGFGQMVDAMYEKIMVILEVENVVGVMVYGDTNSTLAGSLAASKLKLPIFHIESGLRSYNSNMYEEINRLITDHLSTVLFCPTNNAVENLKKEKVSGKIILSGDIMYDSFLYFSKNNKQVDNVSKKYALATIHRRENLLQKDKLKSIFNHLDKINDHIKVLLPLHPHTKKRLIEYGIKSKITFVEPMGFKLLINSLNNCEFVITDSGGLQKEAFFAQKKCLTVRDETEWVELVDFKANVLCTPFNLYEMYISIDKMKPDFSQKVYGNGQSSKIICDTLHRFF